MSDRYTQVRTLVFALLLAGCGHSPPPVAQSPAAAPPAGPAVVTPSPAPAVVADPPAPDAAGPEPDVAQATESPAAANAANDPDYSFYETEAIGPLHAGMTAKELIAVLGAPRAKEPAMKEEATGGWFTTWTWRGASALMVSVTKKGPWRARDVSVTAPSSYATKRGIRIGSTRADAERLYPRPPDNPQQDADTYVVGSVYGGMLFLFAHDRVTTISIGAFAF